jgi:hypothetical protein
MLDPSAMVEYRAHGLEISKQIKELKKLTYMDVVSLGWLIQVIDKFPTDAKEIAMTVLGYNKETKTSDLDA